MSEGVRERRWQLAVRLSVVALVWSLGLMLAALLVGAYSGQATSADGLTLTTRTFVQVNGARSLVLVALPLVACLVVGLALWQRHRRPSAWSGRTAWTAVALLTIEAALGVATIGLFLIPVAVLLALSVRLVPGPATAPTPVTSPAAPAIDR